MAKSRFGDTKFYRERKAIVERFNAAVPALKKLHQNGFYKEAIQKFRGALQNSQHDMGVLPVFRDSGLSPSPEKHLCVAHLVARFVVDFWKYERKNGTVKTVVAKLVMIETIARDGLDAYEVWGEEFAGWRLERKN